MRPMLASLVLLAVLSGCNLPAPTTLTAAASLTPRPADTLIPTLTFTPAPPTVACSELSLSLDPALGSGAACESLPEVASSSIPMDIFIYPAHTELTLQGYPLSGTQWEGMAWVYPVERFAELLPGVIPQRLADLQGLIAGGTWGGGALPFLPPVPDYQSFYSHLAVVPFNSGRGIRYVTEYDESRMPISSRNIFYTFQGLTADGKYWVALTLPVSSPLLPRSEETLPAGHSLQSINQEYSAYAAEVKAALEAQPEDSFYPTLQALDALVASITIATP